MVFFIYSSDWLLKIIQYLKSGTFVTYVIFRSISCKTSQRWWLYMGIIYVLRYYIILLLSRLSMVTYDLVYLLKFESDSDAAMTFRILHSKLIKYFNSNLKIFWYRWWNWILYFNFFLDKYCCLDVFIILVLVPAHPTRWDRQSVKMDIGRKLLEQTWLMYATLVPKLLWGEAVLTCFAEKCEKLLRTSFRVRLEWC